MKKIMSLILAVLLVLSLCPLTALADEITSTDGDWEYRVIYEENEKRYGELTAYKGDQKVETLILPAEIDGVQIVGITGSSPTYAINGIINQQIKRIIIPEGYKYLKEGSFHTINKNWVDFCLPSSLEFIGYTAFYQTNINSINLPEGLKAISSSAFLGSSFNDRSIVLPESLEYIGNKAFSSGKVDSVHIGEKAKLSNGLYYSFPAGTSETSDWNNENYNFSPFADAKQITVDKNNTNFKVVDNALYTYDMETLLNILGNAESNMGSYTLPDTVRKIDRNAFRGKIFDWVFLGKLLECIPSHAFETSEISTLLFANGCRIKSIDSEAFKGSVIKEMPIIPMSVTTIDSKAFQSADVSDISFEKGSRLNYIGREAFSFIKTDNIDLSNCHCLTELEDNTFKSNSIKTVNLKNTHIKYLDNNFIDCRNLTKVVLSRHTTHINNSFINCPKLENINMDNVIMITSKNNDTEIYVLEQFNSCSNEEIGDGIYNGFCYYEYQDSISIIGYSGDEKNNLSIPDTINDKPVTEISEYAFNNAGLTGTLEIPSTVITLAEGALQENNISELVLNEGLVFIDIQAINELPITELRLPDSVEFVAENHLPELKNLYIGASCINADKIVHAMDYHYQTGEVSNIENFIVSKDNPYYASFDGVLYNKDFSELIQYPCNNANESYAVPETVEILGEKAFWYVKELKKVTVTKNVALVDFSTFFNQESIETVVFTENHKLKSLNRTFINNKGIKTVIMDENMALEGMFSTFRNSYIERITLPKSIRYLAYTFDFTPLSEVTFSEGIETIGEGAFSCTLLSNIELPNSLKSIQGYAFERCELKSIDLNNVRSLGECAFSYCQSLTSIDLTGVRYDNSEKKNTFLGCDNLKKFYFTKEEKEEYIAENEFQGNEILETVVIGNGITQIREKAFADCTNLETALIASGVETIDDTAFDNCEKLTILCEVNSPAMLFAKRNDISYQTFVIAPIPDQAHTGKAIKPALNVSQGGNPLTVNKDYKATYTNNINIGKAKVSVVGLGDYSIFGATANFNIVHKHKFTKTTVKPTYAKAGYTKYTCSCGYSYKTDSKPKLTVPATSIKKLTKGKTTITVSFKKVKNVSGYQIEYSKNKSFKSSKKIKVSAEKSSAKLKKLSSKKKYYVRIRAYKKSGGKTYYSSWSSAKSTKTK